MPEYADIYALAKERNIELIRSFLDCFLPQRSETADEYQLPEGTNEPHIVFKSADELIAYCCNNPAISYSIYWRSTTEDEHADIFFLEDGGIIFGISTPAENHSKVDFVANELSLFLNTDEVIVTYEDLPPGSIADFHAFFVRLPATTEAAAAEAARQTRAHRPIRPT